ncbi:MAG: hypothetical protein LC650_00535 [Actinobacteria bacterium]|nr:hypothetical protein [Actinomycetota bacterium]
MNPYEVVARQAIHALMTELFYYNHAQMSWTPRFSGPIADETIADITRTILEGKKN